MSDVTKVLKQFDVVISSETIVNDSNIQQKVYFISTVNLVNQIFMGLSLETLDKLNMVTPLSAFEPICNMAEVQILSNLVKVVGTSNLNVEYIDSVKKTGIIVTFTSKETAAELVKLVCDHLTKGYEYESKKKLI